MGVKNGARVLNSTDQMGSKAGVVAFTGASLQESPEAIKAVFKAYNDAVAYMQKEPAANYLDFLIQEQGFPAEVKESIKLPQFHNAQLPEAEVFSDVVAWLQAKNLIKGSYEYKDLVDETILR